MTFLRRTAVTRALGRISTLPTMISRRLLVVTLTTVSPNTLVQSVSHPVDHRYRVHLFQTLNVRSIGTKLLEPFGQL